MTGSMTASQKSLSGSVTSLKSNQSTKSVSLVEIKPLESSTPVPKENPVEEPVIEKETAEREIPKVVEEEPAMVQAEVPKLVEEPVVSEAPVNNEVPIGNYTVSLWFSSIRTKRLKIGQNLQYFENTFVFKDNGKFCKRLFSRTRII